MTRPGPCPICGNGATQRSSNLDSESWNCLRCGSYTVSATALEDSDHQLRSPETIRRLSGWIQDRQSFETRPRLNANSIDVISKSAVPPLAERAWRLLERAAKIVSSPLADFDFNDMRLWGISYSVDLHEIALLRDILVDQGFIQLDRRFPSQFARLTAKGHIEIERRSLTAPQTNQAFVAMWFDKSMQSAFVDGIRPAIEDAGYTPLRIDQKEHANKIDDEIIAEIRKSKFLVADLTGNRGGVYYEAGFAYGLGLTVIYCCHKDALEDVHFDIRQFNTIVWTEPSELRTALKTRIEAILGHGPKN